MNQNPLFYRSIVALNREAHAERRIRSDATRFGFARASHVVPATIDEFAIASRSLPIVFMPGAVAPTPVFLTGLRSGESRLVSEDGEWTGRYVPAFVRRYPFILGDVPDGEPIVCIDEAAEVAAETDGQRLFTDGKEEPFLNEMIALMTGYYQAAQRTEVFAKLVVELGLLKEITINVKDSSSSEVTIHGFMAIDEERLNALGADQFAQLREQNQLKAVYSHLSSLSAIDLLVGQTKH
jgi:hypothetical protein